MKRLLAAWAERTGLTGKSPVGRTITEHLAVWRWRLTLSLLLACGATLVAVVVLMVGAVI